MLCVNSVHLLLYDFEGRGPHTTFKIRSFQTCVPTEKQNHSVLLTSEGCNLNGFCCFLFLLQLFFTSKEVLFSNKTIVRDHKQLLRVASKPKTPKQYIFILFLNYRKKTEFFPPIVKALSSENFMFHPKCETCRDHKNYREFKRTGPYIGKKYLIES